MLRNIYNGISSRIGDSPAVRFALAEFSIYTHSLLLAIPDACLITLWYSWLFRVKYVYTSALHDWLCILENLSF